MTQQLHSWAFTPREIKTHFHRNLRTDVEKESKSKSFSHV